jgi:magnesium transporter
MKVTAWQSAKLREGLSLDDLPALIADPKAVVWVDLADSDDAEVDAVADLLHLHHLVVEDIRERNERAKIQVYDDYVHVVMFSLEFNGQEPLEAAEIDLVVGKGFLLSAHGASWDPRRSDELRGGLARILAKGADFLLWALVDDLVDSYFPLFDRLADGIDELEDLILTQPGRGTVARIFDLKRNLLTVRRVTSPQREIFNQLTNRELAFVAPAHLVYFRDVYDHLIRLTDELDSFQDRLTGALDAYLSTVNNNLSEIMKRLTAVTVILAGVAAIGGIFGMSEAGPAFLGREAAGFWLVTGVSIAFAGLAIAYLRRIGWL